MTTQTDTGIDAVTENRRLNIVMLQELFPSGAVLAKFLGVHWTLISNVRTKDAQGHYRRTIGEKLARKLEKNMGVEVGWLDRPQFPDALPPHIVEAANLDEPARRHTRKQSPLVADALVQSAQVEPDPASKCSAIQVALMDTVKRLIDAQLIGDMECLGVLQLLQPQIAKLNSVST